MKKSILLFFLTVALQHISAAQNHTIDSLQAILKTAGEDTNKVNTLNALSYELLYSDTDTTIYYATLAKDLSEKLNYSRGTASAYLRLGQAYNNLGNYDQSQSYLSKALAFSTDKLTTAKIYVNIGINHYEMSNYPEALKDYFTGLKAFEEAGDQRAVGSVYNNIALIYADMGKYDEALKSHVAAKKIREANGDKRGIAGSYLNIGIIYFARGNYADALKNYFEARKMYEELGDKNEVALAYNHIGVVYKNQQQYAEALKNYFAALKIQEEIGDKEGIAVSYTNIGTAHLEDGKARQAREWLMKGLQMAKEIGIKTTIQDAYLGLARADSALGNYKDSYAHHKMYIVYRDSIANKENTEKIVQQKMQYDFNRKEELAKIQQQRIHNRQNIAMASLGIIVLVALIIAYLLWRFNQQKQKANTLLQQKNEEIQMTLHELKATQAQLIQREKMASLGELTAGIAHEIQNPLNFVNNFSELSKELVEELKDEQKKDIRNIEAEHEIMNGLEQNLDKVALHGKRAEAIIKSMMEHSRSSTGLKELTDLNALVEEYLRLAFHGMRVKDKSFNTHFKTEYDTSIGMVKIVPQDMGRVLLNLFNNAFYSVREKKDQLNGSYEPVITVSTMRADNKIMISVRDNGMGIPQSIINKIYQPFFTTKPTGQGTGLGLSLSYDIITKMHGGELKVDTKEGEYAEFIIQLPL